MARLLNYGLAVCAAAGFASAANADTATTTFQVSATVASACTLSATGLVFGTYAGAELDGTTTVTANCSTGTTYNVGLNAGSTGGSTVTNRRMVKTGGQLLSYALFRDAGRTQNWGNTVGNDTVSGSGDGTAQGLTVYGRIPGTQTPLSGSYNDTITATITF